MTQNQILQKKKVLGLVLVFSFVKNYIKIVSIDTLFKTVDVYV